jgi:cobyric acid synthase
VVFTAFFNEKTVKTYKCNRLLANHDDFDALEAESSARVLRVAPGRPLPGNARLVILPGSKATISDLAFFRAQGWDLDLLAHIRRGGYVLGLCGGYQMPGKTIADPLGLEGEPGVAAGLGLLPVNRAGRHRGETCRLPRHRQDPRHCLVISLCPVISLRREAPAVTLW